MENEKKSIASRVKDFLEGRKTKKFYKYAGGYNPEDREKALKQWTRLSEENQISFLKYYTTISYYQSGGDIVSNENASRYGFSVWVEKFQEKLIDDLWRNSDYNVQKSVAYNKGNMRIPHWNHYVVNINWGVVWRNIRFTDSRLQKQFVEELINGNELDSDSTFLCQMENWTTDTEEWTLYRLTREARANLFRARVILWRMEEIDSELLLEKFDDILKAFKGTILDDKTVKEFVDKIPENIRNQKIYTTFDYTVRDDNLFAQKWEKLSYSEKIEALRNIFKECIFEGEEICSPELTDTNLVRRMYPDYRVDDSLKNSRMMRMATVSYDSKVIKRIIGSLRGDDIEKYVISIIKEKIDNPYTIYYIWGSLDRRVQEKLYDQVMGIIEGKPKSQYALWCAIRNNSGNQKKKLNSVLSEIQWPEDVEKKKSWIRYLVKGVEKNGEKQETITKTGNDEKEEEH